MINISETALLEIVMGAFAALLTVIWAMLQSKDASQEKKIDGLQSDLTKANAEIVKLKVRLAGISPKKGDEQ